MAQNKNVLKMAKKMAEARNRIIERDTTEIYAAIAIALFRMLDMPDKEKYDAIHSIFAESQGIWMQSIEEKRDMVQKCIEETGIDIRNFS